MRNIQKTKNKSPERTSIGAFKIYVVGLKPNFHFTSCEKLPTSLLQQPLAQLLILLVEL